MKIYDLFSKRQKRLRGEVPDVYEYETIPPELRTQVVHIWNDVWGKIERGSFGELYGGAYEAYKEIHDILCREYGMFALGKGSNYVDSVSNYLHSIEETEKVIDVIELSFQFIDQVVRDNPNIFLRTRISPDEAINELNYRFREHGVGYQYKSGQMIKVDSQFIHAEVVKPTLIILSDPIYKGANEEFLNAHEHYRKRRYKECLNDCLKAFESCLKAICKKRGWYYDDKRAAAKDLIQIVFDHELIPSFMQSHFSGLKTTLESGLPTLRNRMSGTGRDQKKLSSTNT